MKCSLSGFIAILYLFLFYQINFAQYGPIDKIITEIRDNNKRLVAREKLLRIQDKKKIPYLIEGLKDSNDLVQADCASALGNFKDTSIVIPVINLIKKSKNNYVKSMCAETLGKLKDERAIEPLINEIMLGIRSIYVSRAIASFGNKASNTLLQNLKKSEGIIKSELIEAFVNMNDKELIIFINDGVNIDEIIELLDHKDAAVRLKAVNILGRSKNRVAVKALLNKKHDFIITASVYGALKNYDNIEITDTMIAIISRYSDKKELGNTGSLEHSNKLNEFVTAIESIRERKDSRIEEVLIKALENTDESIHAIIAESLLNFLSYKSATAIITVLESDVERTRERISFLYRNTKNAEIKKYFETSWIKKDLPIIGGAYEYFLKKRIAGNESLWLDVFKQYANEGMATAFINCGNKKLEAEARKWAARRGYLIVPTFKK